MKLASIALLFACAAFGQATISISSGPPNDAYVTLIDPGGPSGATLYTGMAPAFLQTKGGCSNLGSTCIKISGGSASGPSNDVPAGVLTNIVNVGTTATVTCASTCGVYIKQRVTVSGATVDTDLNGTRIVLTTPSATTYTFTTTNVTNATYNESTLQVSTNQPLTTQPVWTISGLAYDASNFLITVNPASSTTTDPRWRGGLVWANRANY